MIFRNLLPQLLVISAALATLPATADSGPTSTRKLRDAPRISQPDKAPIIAASRAGKRVVGVGDYGIVILSDDSRTFRQAKAVPTRAVLTGVHFINDARGWASGHDGTVLGTQDGGETWQILREEPGKDRVLLSVWFENDRHGFAVGQFGLFVETDDGGKTWRERRIIDSSGNAEAADRHLIQIFAGDAGLVFVAAEAGTIFRSTDGGRNWQLVQTDNKGSFWSGVVLGGGVALVGGMRGHIYRSADSGLSWKEVPSATQQSLTGVFRNDNGSVQFYGMAGATVLSSDQGQSFASQQRADRANLTAVVPGAGGDLLFTLFGRVAAP